MADGGNTFRQATFVGTATIRRQGLAGIDVADSINFASGETVDWFRFRVRGRAASQFTSTTLSYSSGDWLSGMTLYKEGKKKGKLGRVVARVDNVNAVKELKLLPVGTYYIKISGGAPPADDSDPTYGGRISLFGGT
jgi:hypothetical protein